VGKYLSIAKKATRERDREAVPFIREAPCAAHAPRLVLTRETPAPEAPAVFAGPSPVVLVPTARTRLTSSGTRSRVVGFTSRAGGAPAQARVTREGRGALSALW
jgi:hypothetical protein